MNFKTTPHSTTALKCVTSFTAHQHAQTKLKSVKGNTSHTSQSLHSHARDIQRTTRTALTDTVQSRHTPGRPPGSEPVQPPRLAGVWTVADTQTQHIRPRRLAGEWIVGLRRSSGGWTTSAAHGMEWYGMAWHGGRRLHPRVRQRGLGTEEARAGPGAIPYGTYRASDFTAEELSQFNDTEGSRDTHETNTDHKSTS